MFLLKSTPNLKTLILRPLLTECVPNYFTIDATFIGNYRARAAVFHARNLGRVRDMFIHEFGKLCIKRKVSIKESNTLTDHLVNTALVSVMRRVMQEYSDTWKDIGYLKELRNLILGTDF